MTGCTLCLFKKNRGRLKISPFGISATWRTIVGFYCQASSNFIETYSWFLFWIYVPQSG